MESRFRLSSISETEELVRLKNEALLEHMSTVTSGNLLNQFHETRNESLDHSKDEGMIIEDNTPDIRIVSGAYQIGKHPDSCEDAFFIHERGFGVADGVSGWNDYGFSSSAFST
jgi:hypothetical protein